jgi:hypothetical protein
MMFKTPTITALAGTESLLMSAADILGDAQSVAKDGELAEFETQITALVRAVIELAKDVKQQYSDLKATSLL